jgi:60 kDa SS-A/Ro ribonucleoprotein
VLDDQEMVELIAARLRDPNTIRSARAFAYQLLVAYKTTRDEIPGAISEALQDAMEESIARVPSFAGRTVVCVDVSGSMSSAVTGERKGATSVVRCIDVAGLIGAAVLRKNPTAKVIPFHGTVVNLVLNPRDSVITNAEKLAAVGGGATNCAAPLQLLNRKKEAVDLVIMASDNESWADRRQTRGTAMMEEWNILRQRNPKAKLVCLDLQPNRTTQVCDQVDVLNIGGFSDQVFEVIEGFVEGRTGMDRIAEVLEAIELPKREANQAAA